MALEDLYGVPAEERNTLTDWERQRMNDDCGMFVGTIHGKYRNVKGSWESRYAGVEVEGHRGIQEVGY
jgi:hypothetical protein